MKNEKLKKIFLGQKGGTSIYIALLVLSAILIIVLGISSLVISEIKMSSQLGYSVPALYAADAGVEKCLYQIRWQIVDISGDSGALPPLPPLTKGSCYYVGNGFLGVVKGGSGFEAYYDVGQTAVQQIISKGFYKGTEKYTSRILQLDW